MSDKVLTVRELIALLQEEPQDALVRVEGCDCVGFALGVVPDDKVGESEAAYDDVPEGAETVLIWRRQ